MKKDKLVVLTALALTAMVNPAFAAEAAPTLLLAGSWDSCRDSLRWH